MPQTKANPQPSPSKPATSPPLEACRFDASVAIATGDGASPPVKIVARTGQPVDHWYWGRIVHDMSGMQTDAPHIPIDYCHDCYQVLGVGEEFAPGNEGLEIKGRLTPFQADDRASEVIFKSKAGVPYQASIFFDPDRIVLEQVGEGLVAQVNGYQLAGPAVIARQWILRGVAICPYGSDAGSEVQFKQRNPSFQKLQEIAMSVDNAPKPAETAAAEAEEKTTAESTAVETTAEQTAAETQPAAAAAAQPAAATSELATQGQRFLDAFGERGALWFAKGMSFEQAQGLFNASVRDELAAKDNKIKELGSQLTALRGEASPVEFSEGEKTPEERRASEFAAKGVGDNLAAFAAGIKINGKK